MDFIEEKNFRIITNKNNEMNLILRNYENKELSITLFNRNETPSKKYEIKYNLEEFQKNRFFKIFNNVGEIMKEIEKIQENINIQKQLLNSWYENVEKMKNDINNSRKENATTIDNLCNQYSLEDKEFKNVTKMYNLLSNITKYKMFDIEKEENQDSQEVKGYLLNPQNGNVLNYNIKVKINESVENKASKIFNFWKTYVNFNQNGSK